METVNDYVAARSRGESFRRAADRFQSGEDSPSAYLNRCLDRLEAVNAVLRAFVTLDIDGARAAARAADERYRRGAPLSPIDGLPLGVKDVIETRDLPTQMNTRRFAGWQSRRDAACVAALRAAGAIVLGKTVTTEFALGDPGPTTNPWNAAHTPGGSSSGSAAAVAAGLCAAALGTQEIGSLIRPASYCGVLGLKPTFGSLHQGGVHGVSPSQSHLGIVAGTLNDLVAVTTIIANGAGGDPGHPAWRGPALPAPPRRPRRAALIRTAAWPRLQDAARAAFESWIEALRGRDVVVEDANGHPGLAAFERESADAHDVWAQICCWELRWPILEYRDREPGTLGESTTRFAGLGEAMAPADYERALARREAMRAAWTALVSEFDLALMPSATGPAPEGLAGTGSREFNAFSSGFGVPAISLPLLACEGLPLGVQLLGHPWQDAALMEHAAWVLAEFAPGLR